MISPKKPLQGRGASDNPKNRFDQLHLEKDDYVQTSPDDEPPSPKTQFFKDESRSILTLNDSPDVGFDASVNPYRGCEHGCIYCYARPTHEYLGFSAGLDFETKILVKHDAPTLLRKKLLSKSWEPLAVNMSGVTDCYQPIERKLLLTRQCIEVLSEFRNPFTIITKNHLVTRDIDLFKPMAELNAVAVFISVTSLNPDLTQKMEPRTSRPAFRLKAIEQLAQAGIPVGVMLAPIVPGLTDQEIPDILKACRNAGARFAGIVPLRLPYGLKDLFESWLSDHFPERKDRVLNRIREIRGGQLNDSRFVNRMRGEGVYAEQIHSLFKIYTKKYGINSEELKLSTEHFKRPAIDGQMDLF